MTKYYDFRELLEYLAGSGWAEIDDIDDNSGRDYYYVADDESEAYIGVDRGHLVVKINDELVFDGALTDDAVRVFITPRRPPDDQPAAAP